MPVEKPLELKQSSCLAGDDCDITPETDDIQTDEKTKYSIQHQHLHKDGKTTNQSEEKSTHCSLETPKRVIGKQCRHRSDAAECRV